MKKLFGSFLLLAAFSTNSFAADVPTPSPAPAPPVAILAPAEKPGEQKSYPLKCEAGEVCFEQHLKDRSHEFTIDAGTKVKIEVTAQNGSSIGFHTDGVESYNSEVEMAATPVAKTISLEANIGKSGKFTVDADPAEMTTSDGKAMLINDGYNLKITRVKPESKGAAI